MTFRRIAPVGALLLAGLALAPLASATPPSACMPEDVDFWYNLAHEDGTFEQAEWANETRRGDHVWMQGGADLHCSGQDVSLVLYACSDGEATIVFEDEATLHSPVSGADFTYFEFLFDIPNGSYALAFWFGGFDDEDAVLLDFTSEADCFPPPDCPADLQARANDDESITLTWAASEGAHDYYVMRMENDLEGWQRVAVTADTTWTDHDTQSGVSYDYWVMAHADGMWSEDCPTVTVTAVPFLGAPLLGALAVVGSVGAYAWMRRRA